jgi:hypothetical protein
MTGGAEASTIHVVPYVRCSKCSFATFSAASRAEREDCLYCGAPLRRVAWSGAARRDPPRAAGRVDRFSRGVRGPPERTPTGGGAAAR